MADDFSTWPKLGESTYGKVYQKNDTTVIKVMDKFSSNESEKYCYQNLQECVFLSQFVYDHIISCKGVSVNANNFIIELEKCEISLWDYINKTDFAKRMSVLPSIIFQLVCVLREIHRYGIIHGDIKPCNIMFNTSTNMVHLIDFGGITTFNREHNTNYNNICTLEFCPPEGWDIYKHTGNNTKFDIWSLGVTIYYFISKSYILNHDEADANKTTDKFKKWIRMYEYYPVEKNIIGKLDRKFRSMLKYMLMFNPHYRISANELYNMDCFDELKVDVKCKIAFNMFNFGDRGLVKNSNIRRRAIKWLYCICLEETLMSCFVLTVKLFDVYCLMQNIWLTKKNYTSISYACLVLASMLVGSHELRFKRYSDFVKMKFGVVNASGVEIVDICDKIIMCFNCKLYFDTFEHYIPDPVFWKIRKIVLHHDWIGKTNNELVSIYKNLQT